MEGQAESVVSTDPELHAPVGPPWRFFFRLLLRAASSEAAVPRFWGSDLASLGLGVVRPEATPADDGGFLASRSFLLRVEFAQPVLGLGPTFANA